jgi:hypothetical protein
MGDAEELQRRCTGDHRGASHPEQIVLRVCVWLETCYQAEYRGALPLVLGVGGGHGVRETRLALVEVGEDLCYEWGK